MAKLRAALDRLNAATALNQELCFATWEALGATGRDDPAFCARLATLLGAEARTDAPLRLVEPVVPG